MKPYALKQFTMTGVSLAVLAAAAGHAGMAQAQTTQTQESTTALEEVVVTAQRREESLQSVPVAVTAITGAQLAQHQILDVGKLSAVAPNMSFGPAYDPTDIVLGIRGISETVPQLGVDPAVGIYVDDVYYAITPGANTAFIDMQRVEVLRGPQGTLFGRNTIGGALNITTQKPTDQFEGSAEVELGNYDERKFTGIVNIPVIKDTLAARVVFQHEQHSGYTHNDFLNQDTDNGKQDYVRASVSYHPNEKWTVLASGDYFKFTGASRMQKIGYYNTNDGGLNAALPFLNGHPGDLLTNYQGGDFYSADGGINPATSVEKYSFTGTVTGQLNDYVTLKSITGYTHLNRNEGTDVDGTPYAILDILAAPVRAKQFSQEVQVFGDLLDKKLQWIGGLYYFSMDGSQADLTNVLEPVGVQNYLSQTVKNRSYAAFAQVTYELAPGLRLTGGVRYTKDEREAVNYDHSNNFAGQFMFCNMPLAQPALSAAACHLSGKADFSYVPWTAGIDYKPTSDIMLYAKVSKGYRSGGFPQSGPTFLTSSLPSFDPENVMSYEVGSKLELFDHALRFNTAVFYADYNKIQQSFNVSTASGPQTVTQNVGKARYWGAEFEAEALIQKLHLNANVGLIDPKFTGGPLADPVESPVSNVSKVTVALNASYPIELQSGTLTFTADYNWRSKLYYFEPILGAAALAISDPAAQNSNIAQKAFGLLDATVAFRLANYPVTVSVWGRNLTDKEYKARVTGLVQGGLPIDPYIPGVPRTYGVALKYEF